MMNQLRRLARMTLALGIMALMTLGYSASVIVEISGGGQVSGLTLTLLRVSGFIFFVFIALTLSTMWKVLGLASSRE